MADTVLTCDMGCGAVIGRMSWDDGAVLMGVDPDRETSDPGPEFRIETLVCADCHAAEWEYPASSE